MPSRAAGAAAPAWGCVQHAPCCRWQPRPGSSPEVQRPGQQGRREARLARPGLAHQTQGLRVWGSLLATKQGWRPGPECRAVGRRCASRRVVRGAEGMGPTRRPPWACRPALASSGAGRRGSLVALHPCPTGLFFSGGCHLWAPRAVPVCATALREQAGRQRGSAGRRHLGRRAAYALGV